MRVKTFLILSMIFSGCGKLPLVTLTQLDISNQKAIPHKIIRYDYENCDMVTETQPAIPLLSSSMEGSFCLSPKDAGKLKAHFQSECKINNEKQRLAAEIKNQEIP